MISPLVAEVDDAECDGCKSCLRACRYNALTWVHGEGLVWVDLWQCTGCGSCETACPRGAVRLAARSNGSG